MKNRILSFVLAVLIMLMPMTAYAADSAKASTLRLEKTEGSVSLSNKNGKTLTIKEGAKLYNGNTVTTSAKSYAYISLDATKAVKLDASSKAEVRQSGKKLEINLKSGNLFFNVTVPLEEDETLNIRTSTTITGVRGTSGVINVLSDTESMIYILDGNVFVTATDPKTGKTKEIAVGAGQAATVSDGSVVETKPITSDMISGFAAQEIKKDSALQEKIAEQTDLPIEKIIDNADEKLNEDQQKSEEKQKDINKQVEERKKADSQPSANQTTNAATTTPSYESNSNQSNNSNNSYNSNNDSNTNNNNTGVDNSGNNNNNNNNNSGGNNSGGESGGDDEGNTTSGGGNGSNNDNGGTSGGGGNVNTPTSFDVNNVESLNNAIAIIRSYSDSETLFIIKLKDIITLNSDIELEDLNIKLDLNGKTLFNSNLYVAEGSKLEILNGGGVIGNLTINAGGHLTLTGVYTNGNIVGYAASDKSKTSIIINGGTIHGNILLAGTGSNGELEMNAVTMVADSSIVNNGGWTITP